MSTGPREVPPPPDTVKDLHRPTIQMPVAPPSSRPPPSSPGLYLVVNRRRKSV